MNAPALTEEQIKAKFDQACIAHQNGQIDVAEELYNELLDLFPGTYLLHYNLGLLYQESGRYKSALGHYLMAIKDNSNDPDLLFNTALCHKSNSEIEEAISLFLKCLKLQPESIDVLYNLAGCYRALNEWAKAKELYLLAYEIDKDYQPVLSNLAYTHHRLGETDDALALYEKLISLNPEHKSAKHMIATLRDEEILNIDNDYITELFDDYSDSFEQDLLSILKYQVPTLLKSELLSCVDKDHSFSNVLDLGCGTGLAGLEIHKNCSTITGIDLSCKMLAKAQEKNIYDQLFATDIVHFLDHAKIPYDLFIAADVFSYVGELDDTFTAVSKRADINSFLAFSIEKIENNRDLELGATGRFKHSGAYIKRLSTENGFEVLKETEVNLRQEAGKWVKGYLYVLKKVS